MKSLITLFVSFMLVGFAFTQSTINFDLKTYLDNKFTDMDNKFTDMDNKFTELKEDNQRLEGKVEQKFSTLYSVLTAVVVGFVTLFFPFIFRLYREWIFGGNKQTPLNKEDMQEVMEKVFKQPFLQLSQNQENDYLTKEFLEKEQSRFKKDLLPQLKKDLLSQLKKDLLPQLKKDLLLEKNCLKRQVKVCRLPTPSGGGVHGAPVSSTGSSRTPIRDLEMGIQSAILKKSLFF